MRTARHGPAPVRLAVAALIAIVSAGCSPTPTTPPSSSVAVSDSASPDASAGPSTRATFPPTKPAAWRDCGNGFGCATLRLPRDYDDLTKGTLDVAVIRRAAELPAKKVGSLILNPGGPGGSGVEFVRDNASEFPQAIRERFDIVGFDPRGVNSSSAVRCIDDLDGQADVDPSPDDAREIQALLKAAKAYAAACERRNADLLPYLSTAAVVEDLDRVRQAVGDERITYLGFSYGTLIGSMYADRFPDHIRAMVLDGAVDPSLSETTFRTDQAKAFEAALGRFFKRCSKDRKCLFYEGGHTKAAYDALMKQIDQKPLPILRYAGRRKVGPGLAFYATLGALYNRSSWRSLELALYAAKRGDGRYLVAISDPYRGRKPNGAYSNQNDAYYANTCLDFPVSTDPATYDTLSAKLRQIAPRFRAVAYNDLNCAYWAVAAQRTPAPATGTGAPPIVVVGSTGDPATPYAWAKSLAGQLESATLITRKGEGHTGYFFSDCVQKAVDAYLVDLTVPRKGLSCKSTY